MPSGRPTLLLLDSASLYFRSFYGVPESIRAPDGTPVNAVRGFLDTIAYLLTARRPQRLVACWDDDWRPAFRVAALPSYKAHRVEHPTPGDQPDVEETPPSLDAQIPMIVEVLQALGVARIGAAGHEADDVIGALATHARPGWDVEVVTGDRDLFQLVEDERRDQDGVPLGGSVRVLYVGRGVRNLEVVDQARLQEKYGVRTGRGYAELAILRGDPSDGLPGVAGIGEKTAARLVGRYGSLDAILAALDDPAAGFAPGLRARLRDARDYLAVAPDVVRVARDVPLPSVADAAPARPADPDLLLDLAERWNLAGPCQRLVDALAGAA